MAAKKAVSRRYVNPDNDNSKINKMSYNPDLYEPLDSSYILKIEDIDSEDVIFKQKVLTDLNCFSDFISNLPVIKSERLTTASPIIFINSINGLVICVNNFGFLNPKPELISNGVKIELNKNNYKDVAESFLRCYMQAGMTQSQKQKISKFFVKNLKNNNQITKPNRKVSF